MSTFGPTVAGRFYPSNPAKLEQSIKGYLAGAKNPDTPLESGHRVVGIIVPHAGYVYSGSVAGFAYATVTRQPIRTVIVLGPSHRVARSKAATLKVDVYRTPIGDVPIDVDLVTKLLQQGAGLLMVDEGVFEPEHSVDVQIPFIKMALPQARVVPIVVPSMPEEQLEALGQLLFRMVGSDPHTLIVLSSDLSHFFDYSTARKIDAEIVHEIETNDTAALLNHRHDRRGPCGAAPVVVGLSYLESFGKGGKVTTLKVLNSGDTAGDRSRVVGYSAMALSIPAS
jgi:AmmeMemoRadiSam system protein B